MQGAAAVFEQVSVALYADLLVPILLVRYFGTGIAEEHPIMMGNRCQKKRKRRKMISSIKIV
jgi:hypothetical protein